jgi:outer membrane immunogenic protein
MNKLLGVAGAALLFAGPALAADLPVKAPVKALPPPVPVFSWTSCYIGGNVGGAWAHTSFSDPVDGSDLGSNTASSFVGGGQIGCDYQTGPWVFGVQGLFDAASLKGSNPVPLSNETLFNDNKWFATLTGRIGYTIQPALLLYAKGGAAWTRDEISLAVGAAPAVGIATDTRTGWTAGVGLEYMFAPNWSAFAEYDFLGFGTKTVGTLAGPLNVKQDIQAALVGINFRFRP